MTLAQRIKRGLQKAIPGSKIEWRGPVEKNQSVLSDAQLRKMKNKRTTPPNGSVGRGSNGIGVGY